MELPPARGRRRSRISYWTLALGFACLIVLGTVLLMLPWATEEASITPPLIAIFTATSAVCVTGLVVVDTGSYWTAYGQTVIAVLIFLGGLGIMTSATLLFLLIGRRLTLANRLLIKESMGAPHPGGMARLVRVIAITAIVIQLLGFGAVWALLVTGAGGLTGNAVEALGYAAFHAVSSFNNAGFDIFPHPDGALPSIARFHGHAGFLLITILLALLGAISFSVIRDVAANKQRFRRYLLDTKLVLVTSAGLLVVGTVAILVLEFTNTATMGGFAVWEKVLNSALFSTVSRTAGFATADFGQMRLETGFFMTGLMFIGGASASTAGGIKVNTFAVLMVVVLSSLRGRPQPVAFGRSISPFQVYRALVVAMVALIIVFTTAFFLTITEETDFFPTFFETVSAFGTVGLSRGITGELSSVGRAVIIAAMYLGRLGPLTLALALAQAEGRTVYRYGEERVKIG